MIEMIFAAVGLRRLATSPYGMAALAAGGILALVVVGFVYLKVHDAIVIARATAVCEEKEKADRLEKANQALLEAKAAAERTLKLRGDALRTSENTITALETQLEEARNAANALKSSCSVVFPADDPWLRRKAPPASSGRDNPGSVPAPR